jgi:type I restriction enzyme R subunit
MTGNWDEYNQSEKPALDLFETLGYKVYDQLINHISLEQDLGHGKKNQTVKYIDYENLYNNSFIAIKQFRVKGKETIKPDITLFVNGLPMAVIECKNNTTCNDPEVEAIKQLRRYQNIRNDDTEEGAEELFYPNQLLVAACGD